MRNLLLSLAAHLARLLPQFVKQTLYRLGPLTHVMRSILNWAAPKGIHRVNIAGGYLQGLPFMLDMQKEKDYWLGTYEARLASVLPELVPAGAMVYEAGANVGYTSLCLGQAAGAKGTVYCFEPLPSNIERLRQNVALNNALCDFRVVPKAVSGDTGRVEFLVHRSDDMGKINGSAGRAEEYHHQITVDTISLDDFVYKQGNPPPQVIKIDIEGGEVLALPGMMKLLVEDHPLVMIELHGPESARAAWQAFTRAGYSMYRIEPGSPVVSSPQELDWKAYLIARPNV